MSVKISHLIDSEIIQGLEDERIDLDVKRLDGSEGDYSWGDYAIKRIDIDDLIKYDASGKLWREINQIKAISFRTIVLVRGDLNNIEMPQTRNEIISIISRIMIQFKIPIIVLNSNESEICFVSELYSLSGRESSKKDIKKVSIDPYINVVGNIPGMSMASAVELKKMYTVHEVFNLGYEDFVAIEGMGEKRAKRIIDFIHEEKPKLGMEYVSN